MLCARLSYMLFSICNKIFYIYCLLDSIHYIIILYYIIVQNYQILSSYFVFIYYVALCIILYSDLYVISYNEKNKYELI